MITSKNGTEECVEGAVVRLLRNDEEIGRTESDAFGDFKIERLSRGLGSVAVHIEAAGSTKSLDVDLDDSLYLGCIAI